MTELYGLIVSFIVLLAVAGWGAILGAVCRLEPPNGTVGFALSCAAGIVLFGWIGFFMLLFGLTGFGHVLALVVCGLAGAVHFRHRLFASLAGELRRDRAVFAIAAVLLGVDLLAATMPVLDADSNAYHFTLPLQFLTRGELFLIPRAVDGAVPLLFQTTYALTLKLGGETAMLLLPKLVVWLSVLLIYGLLRQWTGAAFAALAALVFLTIPAVVYGMAGGQVETRISLLALGGGWMIYAIWRCPSAGNAALAGVMCGGIAGAKFTGLLFGPAACLAILIATRNLKLIGIALLAGLLIGAQWYVWLWIETGSPVFPLLAGPPYWHPENEISFANRILSTERSIPANLHGMITYPFLAFWNAYPGFEAGRTGAGPAFLALIPIALIGGVQILKNRAHDKLAGELFGLISVFLVFAVTFYVLWWHFGASQRVRHLVPTMSVFIVGLGLPAFYAARRAGRMRMLLMLLAVISVIQLGGWAFYHRATVAYASTGFDKQRYLSNRLVDYQAIQWMKQNLPPDSLLVLLERQNNFHIGIPFYRVSSDLERLVDVGENARDPERFLREVRAVGGTHILFHLIENPGFTVDRGSDGFRISFHADIDSLGREGSGIGRYHQLVMKLLRDGCAEILHHSRTRRSRSRTLGIKQSNEDMVMIVELTGGQCPYADALEGKPVNRIHTNWTDATPNFIPGR